MSLGMQSKLQQLSRSVYVVVGPEGATNFAIVKAADASAVVIDADIRRIDEVEEALRLTGCARVGYLVNTHEHFDHTSANYYFAQRQIAIVGSAACARAMNDEGEADFARMMAPVAHLYGRFSGLRLTPPDVLFEDTTKLSLPGITLHLKYRAENGHSHSKGDTTIYCEEDQTLIAGDLLYTEVHPVTFFGNIPNWLSALKPLFGSDYQQLVPGHGPAVENAEAGRQYFKRMYDYLEDFYGKLCEIEAGQKSAAEVTGYMLGGGYAPLGKTRMVERNIKQFLTGKWY